MSDRDAVLESHRQRLASGAREDADILAAIRDGVAVGAHDVAARILPALSSAERLALLDAVAERSSKPGVARLLRAASFAEAPASNELFEAAVAEWKDRGDARALGVTLRLREGATDDIKERRALLSEQVKLHERAGALFDAVAALARWVACASGPEEIARLVFVAERMAADAGEPDAAEPARVAAQDRGPQGRGLPAAEAGETSPPWSDALADLGTGELVSRLADDVEQLLETAAAQRVLSAVSEAVTSLESGSSDRPGRPSNGDVTGAGSRSEPVAEAAWSIREILDFLSAGELAAAMIGLEAGPADSVGLASVWLRAGHFAVALARFDDARKCFAASAERASTDEARRSALRGLADACMRRGTPREAARVLAALAESQPSDVRAPEILEVARAHLAARDPSAARPWLERAVTADPSDSEAAAALVRALADEGDQSAVSRWVARVAADRMASGPRARWLTAQAAAWAALGDFERARTALSGALEADQEAMAPAETLFQLGASAGRDAWIDESLRELRRRAAERGDRTRVFVAASLSCARGTAVLADRVAYATLRIERSGGAPRPLGAGWVRKWLGFVVAPAGAADLPRVARSRDAPLTEEARANVAWVAAAFGVPAPRIRVAPGEEVVVGRADDELEIGIPAASLTTTRLAFDLGRAMAVLAEPALAPGLGDPEGAAGEAGAVVDRAGLAACGDPMVALAAVGAFSPRGRRLTPFAGSPSFTALLKRLGAAPRARAPLPKHRPRA